MLLIGRTRMLFEQQIRCLVNRIQTNKKLYILVCFVVVLRYSSNDTAAGFPPFQLHTHTQIQFFSS